MVQDHWRSAVDGDFGTAADWSTGAVPGSGDDAILDAPGSLTYSVTVSEDITVNSIQTAASALLDIKAGFTASNGTGLGVNAGGIRVENGATLTLQGTVANVGTMELYGTVSPTSIVLGPGPVTLEGGGAIFLNFSGGQFQQIIPSASGSVLTDVDNRISGQGLLGGAGLTIINEAQGFLEAKSGPLTITTGANTIINAGLIDAEGAPGSDGLPPGLAVVESPVDNSGIVEAGGDGSTLTFQGAVTGTGRAIIMGGTLSFDSGFNQDVDFETSSGVLFLAQSSNYTGQIQQFSTSGGDSLDLGDIGFVGGGEATYSGTTSGGVLTVTDGLHTARISFEGDYTQSTFVVSSDGRGGTMITANSAAVHWLNPVSGLFQTAADWTDGVAPGPGDDAILDAPATTDYTVTASQDETVNAIELAPTAALNIEAVFSATSGTASGANDGAIYVRDGGSLTLQGTVTNVGLIELIGAGSPTSIVLGPGGVTLDGGGEVFMSSSASNIIVGSSSSVILDNTQNTIAGAGDLGDGELTLINGAAGKIESEGQTTPLIIDTGADTIANAGLIEAAGAGATIASPVANTGFLKADGGNLTVNGAVTGTGEGLVGGGTLRFNAAFNENVVFQGASGVLALAQSANYTGAVFGFSTAGTESLDLADIRFVAGGEATFSGTATSGVLTVSDGFHSAHIQLTGNYTAAIFSANSDGVGGTVITDGSPVALHWLSPVNGSFQTPADWTGGVAPGPGDVAILDAPGATHYSVSATASQAVAAIQTAVNATLSVTGSFAAANNDGIDSSNAGLITVGNGGTLTVAGMLDNAGLITLGATSNHAILVAAGALTLTGGGEVFMSNNAGNIIVGSTALATLTNTDDTIAGSGDLGDGGLTLINSAAGRIEAEGQTTPLIIDTGSHTIANAGLIEAAGAGAAIASPIANAGSLKADGGNLTVNGAVTGTGEAIVDGGILKFNAAFNQNVVFQGGAGVLALAKSANYTGEISGFSTTGSQSLDLGDIAFVGSGEATYNGTATSGVLTVTDGIHTARIHLTGNYVGSIFTDDSDGRGGTIITDNNPPAVDWLGAVSGSFQTAPDWAGGVAPGPGDAAVLGAFGTTNYTVTSSANQTVGVLQTAVGATLEISAGLFAATEGAGSGINAGTIAVGDAATFSVNGILDNTGLLDLQGTSKGADVQIGPAGLTLTGGGKVVLEDALPAPFQPCPPNLSIDYVYGVSGSTLTNVDNTISGAGYIGLAADLTLVNEAKGVIDASLDTDLVLRTNSTVNSGVLEATGAGGLYIERQTVDDSSGGVIAADGGIVYVSYADIIGGALTSSGAGYIYNDWGPSILDGLTAGPVTNEAFEFISAGATLTIEGTIVNIAEIQAGDSTVASSLIIGAGGAVLSGGGKVFLEGNDPNTQIVGATAGATLTNVDNTVFGQGHIGAGSLDLINEAAGVIDATQGLSLTLDTGANTITNSGLIEASGAGGLTIQSALNNGGFLKADGGNLTVNGAVTGTGEGVVDGGTLRFNAAFNENVVFQGGSGVLALTQSANYTGVISGFSTTGTQSLDLGDIGFVSAGEATFVGTATFGVLTVTDGVHTASIHLNGNYTASTFTASSDGQGGTLIVDPTGASPAAAHHFVAAAASMGGGGAAHMNLAESVRPFLAPMLARSRTVFA